MKSSNVLGVGIVMLVLVFLAGCGGKVRFTPLKLHEGGKNALIAAPELITPEYIEQMAIVLRYYNEDFKTDGDGSLQIKASLSKNKELLWNYCTKANDPEFIKMAREKVNHK